MIKTCKLVWLFIIILSIQSGLLAVEKTTNKGFWFFKTKANLETSKTNNETTINNFSDIPLKIFLKDTIFINNEPVYQSCIDGQITFMNNAKDPEKNINYRIDWGDGSSAFSNDSWTNTTHKYTPRLEPYSLVYSFIYADGTAFSKTYKIYIKAKPTFSFVTDGRTDNCVGYDIFFPIKDTEGNSLDTRYQIIFNDGSDTINYIPSTGLDGIFHKFPKSSCGTISSTYQNAFSAKIKAINSCGFSEVSVVPIYVSSSPVVGFSLPVSKNLVVPNVYPSKSSIKIIDTTTGYVNVGGNCSSVPKRVWIITPNTGFTLPIGESLGNDYGLDNSDLWIEGTKDISPTFTTPGNYTIKLRVDTRRCGNNFIEKFICIENPLTTSFDLDSIVGCSRLNVKVTNTTDLSKTCTATYKWEIGYIATNCGNKAGWTYGSGTNETSASPVFNFTSTGTYKLKLSTSNTAGTSTHEKTVVVKQPPTVTINKIPDFCGLASFEPVAIVNSCNDTPNSLSYKWTFEGGTPANSIEKNPGTIVYDITGKYTVKLSVANDCGPTIAVSNTFAVNPIPTVNAVQDLLKCSGELSERIIFSGNDGDVFDWKNNNLNIGLPASGKGNIEPFYLQNNSNMVLNAQLTVTPKNSLTGCNGVPYAFKISIIPKPVMDSVENQVVNNGVNTSGVKFKTKNTGGTTTYNWTNNNPTSELSANGIGNIPIFKAINNTNHLLIYTITVTPTFTNAGVRCTGDSQNFTITINPTAQVNRPPSIELCNGANTPDYIFSTNNNGGTTTYSWSNNNIAIGLNESGSGDIMLFKLTNKTGTHTTATITVTPTFIYNGISNVGDTVQFRITVDPGPEFTSQPVSSYLCKGGSASPMVVSYSGGVGSASYQWYLNNIKTFDGGLRIDKATNATYNAIVTDTGTSYYYCTITLDEGKCNTITSDIATVTIKESAILTEHPTASQKLCIGGTIQSPLKVEFVGGSGEISYEWYSNTQKSNSGGTLIEGADSSTFTPKVFLTANKYYYYVTIKFSGNQCGSKTSNVAEINVVNDPTIPAQPLTVQTVCQNTLASNLVVTPQGGVESIRYKYQWYSNSTNSNTTGNLVVGASDSIFTPPTDSIKTKYYYCVVFQDSLSCNVTSDISVVNVNSNPQIISQLKDTTVCIDEEILPLTINISGGVGTPNYQWYSNSKNNNTSGTIIKDATRKTFQPPSSKADTIYYYCQISGFAGGCSTLTSDPIRIIIRAKAIISSQNLSICSGDSFTFMKGELDYIPDGTKYIWSKPLIIPTNSITGSLQSIIPAEVINQTLINTSTNLATATYTVTPISNSCYGESFTLTVEVIPTISATVKLKNSSCYKANNGFITSTVVGGKVFSSEVSYLFIWTGPNGFSSDKQNLDELLPGNYSLTILDNGGCPFKASYTITEPNEIIISVDSKTNLKCNGDSSGKIDISVQGGVMPYKFNWTKNGQKYSINEDISILGAGKYCVEVTDANACSIQSDTINITEPNALNMVVNKKNVSCFGDSTGEIFVEVTGGVHFESEADYHYQWIGVNNFNSTLRNCTNLLAGEYKLTITDKNSCTKSTNVIILQPEELKLNLSYTEISCYGANNGTITANITGGVKPYTVSWSNFANGNKLTDLLPGNYTIIVTDANGCVRTETKTINEANFSINPIIKNASCNGANNGSINLNINGGVLPIKVRWDDDASAGSVRNNLAPGTYTAHLQDGAPCTITESYEVREPDSLTVTGKITNAFECDNPSSGSILTLVTGGSLPYTYKWDNGEETDNLTNIQSGNYLLTVIDRNGCSKLTTFKVTRQKPILVDVNTSTAYNCEAQKYINSNTASVSGGLSPYQYRWSSGSVNSERPETMKNDQNSVIILYVTDALGCSAEYTFTIDNPIENTSAKINYHLVDCINNSYLFDLSSSYFGEKNNSYLWEFGDGSTSTSKTDIHIYETPGNYRVKLTVLNDICNSYFEQIVIIESTPKVKLDKSPMLCRGESTILNAIGANSYKWSNGNTGDSAEFTEEGDYSVIGTSKSGCKDTLFFKTKFNELMNYSIITDKNEVEVNTALQLWTKNIAYSSYLWDFGDGTPTATGHEINHTYNTASEGFYFITLKATNPNGCTETATKKIWITIPTKPSVITPNGDGVNDIFMKDTYLKLYNRNGLLIFEGTDGWDGTFENKTVLNGTYFYILTYTTEYGLTTKNGYVTVVK